MIIYFSATGNCKYVATTMANAIDDKTCSLLDVSEVVLKDNESLGFVFPTYFWGLPSVVSELLSKTNIKLAHNNYIYFIATYGTSTGRIAGYVENQLKDKNIKLNASFAVRMVDTWTPRFDLSDDKLINKFLSREWNQISQIIDHIKNRDIGNFIDDQLPTIGAKIAQKYYQLCRKTSNFHVETTCIGCGACAKKCPVGAIRIKDKKPVWIKDKCAICLACLHHCPKFAINYKNKTQNHGQYVHP